MGRGPDHRPGTAEAAAPAVLPEVEERLSTRAGGGAVLPDAVVNSVTGAGWWPAPCGLTGRVPARAVATTTTPRAAAHARAAERLPVIAERFGWCR